MREELIQYLRNHKRLVNLLKAIRRRLFRVLFALRRRRVIKGYLECHQLRKLQIGSGENILRGWLNTDLSPTGEVVFLDATKRLPFDDCSFDYVFSEHLIEHLEFRDAVQLVRECHRVLRPRGKIRISTPDISFLIELYGKDKTELQRRYIQWAADAFLPGIGVHWDTFVINNFFRDWGHTFIYDYKTLEYLLQECGFSSVTAYDLGESDDPNLRGIESHGPQFPHDEFNNLESMVLEGTKRA